MLPARWTCRKWLKGKRTILQNQTHKNSWALKSLMELRAMHNTPTIPILQVMSHNWWGNSRGRNTARILALDLMSSAKSTRASSLKSSKRDSGLMRAVTLLTIRQMSHNPAMKTLKTPTKNFRVKLLIEWLLVLATLLNALPIKTWARRRFHRHRDQKISGSTKR